MSKPNPSQFTRFTKSNHSIETGCVEVSTDVPGFYAVRDSNQPTGPVLVFNQEEWTAFTAAVADRQW